MSESTAEAVETTTETTTTATADTPVTLPDDHPLVRTLAAQKEQLKELKGKAQRLDEIEQANLSEVEKAAARAAQAEDDLAAARAETARLRVALKHGLSEEDALHLNDLRDEEAMDRLAGRLAKAAAEGPGRVGFGVDNQNRSTSTTPDADATARAFFGI